MIEKDNIQELFSKAFENQTAPVRPDLWAGVQAKMAAAGVASTATVATKGLSALTKWIIGSAAVGTVGVVTAVVALNSGEEKTSKQKDSPREIAQNTAVTNPEEKSTEEKTFTPHAGYSVPVLNDDQATDSKEDVHASDQEIDQDVERIGLKEDHHLETVKEHKTKHDEKVAGSDDSKQTIADKKEQKREVQRHTPILEDQSNEVVNNAGEHKELIDPAKVGKVTKFSNIFSPDGDYTNDRYTVEVENLVDFKMTIVDQRNKVLFETNDPSEGWDGKFAGEDVKPGAYAVFIDGTDLNGKPFHKAEIIQKIR